MNLSLFAIAFLSLLFQMQVHATEVQYFDLETKKNLRFTQTQKIESKENEKVIQIDTFDHDKKKVMEETITYHKGSLVSYEIKRNQIEATGKIRVTQDKIIYTYTRDNKVLTKEEKKEEEHCIDHQIPEIIQKNIKSILEGKKIKLKLMAVNHQDSFSFEIKLEKKWKENEKNLLQLQMRASSPFVSALIRPAYFTLEEENGSYALKTYEGRTFLKTKDDDRWVDFETYAVYSSK